MGWRGFHRAKDGRLTPISAWRELRPRFSDSPFPFRIAARMAHHSPATVSPELIVAMA